MQTNRLVMLTMGGILAIAQFAHAQNYPNRSIRIIVGGIGGSLDMTARLVAQGISGPLGQPVVVDNRASVVTAAAAVSSAPPDGHSVLLSSPNLWILPLLESKAPFDPLKDFAPVSMAIRSPSILVITPTLPVKSVRELVALARVRPNEINYASGGPGSMSHLAGELFKAKADVKMTRINYNSATVGLVDLASGQVQVMFPVAASTMPYIKSGRLRALAVTSREPTPLVPGVPTLNASGLPGYETVAINGFFVAGGTPETATRRLNQEIVRVLTRDDIREKFFNMGVEPAASSPEAFTAFIKSDIATVGKLIQNSGLRGE